MASLAAQLEQDAQVEIDALTGDLATADSEEGAAAVPVTGLPREDVVFASVAFRYPGSDHDVLSGLG